MLVVSRRRWNLPPLMTKRSMSLLGPISPRAAEPNRMILSGCAASTTRRMMSRRMAGFGRPFLDWTLVLSIDYLPSPTQKGLGRTVHSLHFARFVLLQFRQDR